MNTTSTEGYDEKLCLTVDYWMAILQQIASWVMKQIFFCW